MYLYGRVVKSKPLKTEVAGGITPCAVSLQVFKVFFSAYYYS